MRLIREAPLRQFKKSRAEASSTYYGRENRREMATFVGRDCDHL